VLNTESEMSKTKTVDPAKRSMASLTRAVSTTKSFGASAHNDRIDSILLRLNSIRSEKQDNRLVVGVSSANRKSGVSTIAGKLAVRAAEMAMGRILLIDGNLSSPAIGKMFGIRRQEGLANILSTEVDISELLQNGVVDGLHVLPAGSERYLKNVTVMPDIVSAMMGEFRDQFDLVIMDLPPVKNSARCLALARQTDGIVFVADAQQTRAREAKAAISTLRSNDVNVFGTVLNRVARTLPRWLERWF